MTKEHTNMKKTQVRILDRGPALQHLFRTSTTNHPVKSPNSGLLFPTGAHPKKLAPQTIVQHELLRAGSTLYWGVPVKVC